MICDDCAREADGRLKGYAKCPYCGRTVTLTPKSRRFVLHQTGQFKGIKYGARCLGYQKRPIEGHDACTGCDCQHRKA